MLEERKRGNAYRNRRKAGIPSLRTGPFGNTSMRSCSMTFVSSTPIQTN